MVIGVRVSGYSFLSQCCFGTSLCKYCIDRLEPQITFAQLVSIKVGYKSESFL